jgi:hypothetical protein
MNTINEHKVFTIGVTGHRKLPEGKIPAITQEVKDFYSAMQREHGGQITVLSPLAEGADMLCAKLALDMGLRLIVPLPMSASEYRKDFKVAAAEFDCLLSMADKVFTVTPIEDIPAHTSRGFYYRQAGIYVVKHCDILLAVWDGTERDTTDGAGTWETVKLARESGKAVQRIVI